MIWLEKSNKETLCSSERWRMPPVSETSLVRVLIPLTDVQSVNLL